MAANTNGELGIIAQLFLGGNKANEHESKIEAEMPVPDVHLISGVGDDSQFEITWSEGLTVRYEVSSWSLYDSWEDAHANQDGIRRVAGASEEYMVFPDEIPQITDDESLLTVDIAVTKVDGMMDESSMENVVSLAEVLSESDGVQISELSPCFYFNLGNYAEDKELLDAWRYSLPSEGDSMLVTVGFVVNSNERAMAEKGQLALIVPDDQVGSVRYMGETSYLPLVVE